MARDKPASGKFLPILHPFLLAMCAVLSLYLQNIRSASFQQVVGAIVIAVAGALVVFLAGFAVFRNSGKVALVVSLVVAMFFWYSAIRGLLLRWAWTRQPGTWLLLFDAGLLAAVIWLTARTRRPLDKLTWVLNLAALGILAVLLWNICSYEVRQPAVTLGHDRLEDIPRSTVKVPPASQPALPDVYYIVPDRYASAEALKHLYGFDNQPFLTALKARGFIVDHGAWSNYLKTIHSLGSTLDMDYLHPPQPLRRGSASLRPLVKMLQRRWPVMKQFRAKGYRFVFSGSWHYATARSEFADENINPGYLSEFSWALLNSTAAEPVLRRLKADVRSRMRHRILTKFERLGSLSDTEKPTFVIAHFITPHPPYVFDREGNVPRFSGWTSQRVAKDGYLDQLQFVNSRLLEMIDAILANANRPVVIVLQSDEGPFPERYKKAEDDFDWRTATDDELFQKMGILSAYRLPGVTENQLPNDVRARLTPVNTFRLISDLYLGTTYGMLDRHNYVFHDGRHLYTLLEVTDRLDSILPPRPDIAPVSQPSGRHGNEAR